MATGHATAVSRRGGAIVIFSGNIRIEVITRTRLTPRAFRLQIYGTRYRLWGPFVTASCK